MDNPGPGRIFVRRSRAKWLFARGAWLDLAIHFGQLLNIPVDEVVDLVEPIADHTATFWRWSIKQVKSEELR